MKYCYIPYTEAKKYINEGDVLLFRSKGLISYFIRKAGEGLYSHAALASWVYTPGGHKSRLECVEFREWKGGRAVNLRSQVNAADGKIDVYRASSPQTVLQYDCQNRLVSAKTKYFDGVKITDHLRKLTGLPYGWKRIWWLAKFKIPFLRLRTNGSVYNDEADLIYPVCSTAVAHCYSKNFTDLTPLRSDNRMEPSDLARSPILNYLFTLTSDKI